MPDAESHPSACEKSPRFAITDPRMLSLFPTSRRVDWQPALVPPARVYQKSGIPPRSRHTKPRIELHFHHPSRKVLPARLQTLARIENLTNF